MPDELQWANLLQWLADHGMKVRQQGLLVERRRVQGAGHGLFALQACPPSTPLLTIPANALINLQTLSPHYPSGTLSATQLISLHLCLHRPLEGQVSLDPLFGPYISTLPRDFEFHPLTWVVKGIGLPLSYLPPSTIRALQALTDRFYKDLEAVCHFVHGHPEVFNSASRCSLSLDDFRRENASLISDYSWAWLNVNTRCVYRRMKSSSSDPDNITLCPILDFANHTAHLPHMLLSPAHKTLRGKPVPPSPQGLDLGSDLTLLSPSGSHIEPGEELFLTYGIHCNRTLFVEYGFILADVPAEAHIAEVEVDDILESLFENKGQVGIWMKETLQLENYWKNWTLHASGSAYPSYRLITALRLHSICTSASIPPSDDMVQLWRDATNGKREEVTTDSERVWRETLHCICITVIDRAISGLGALPDNTPAHILALWEEERYVAQCVMDNICEGEKF